MAPLMPTARLDDPDDDMATLVGGLEQGHGYHVSVFSSHKADFQLAAHVPRYFVTIEAFDFKAAEQKNKIPLWCARVSTQAEGTTLEKALPALVSAAAPGCPLAPDFSAGSDLDPVGFGHGPVFRATSAICPVRSFESHRGVPPRLRGKAAGCRLQWPMIKTAHCRETQPLDDFRG